MNTPHPFQRTPWMIAEVRRIARARFEPAYWASIEEALLNCLEDHSVVINNPNKEKSSDIGFTDMEEFFPTRPSRVGKSLAAFVLVCPSTTSSRAAYGIEEVIPDSVLEVAFVATDSAWEGHGFARILLETVLFRCKTTQQSVWLHVDGANEKARAFYNRLGFRDLLHLPDPYGSHGILMVFMLATSASLFPGRNSQPLERTTLFHTTPRQTEQPLSRSVLAPPSVTCY